MARNDWPGLLNGKGLGKLSEYGPAGWLTLLFSAPALLGTVVGIGGILAAGAVVEVVIEVVAPLPSLTKEEEAVTKKVSVAYLKED